VLKQERCSRLQTVRDERHLCEERETKAAMSCIL
jgi:hypothetical protein